MRKKELIIGSIVVLLLLIVVGIQLFSKVGGDVVKVTCQGDVYGIYQLRENQVVQIEVGNVLVIEGGVVYMESATCPNQLCVHQGAVSHIGEAIVCLPYKVVVEINGE